MQSELPEEFYNSTTGVIAQCCKTQSTHPVVVFRNLCHFGKMSKTGMT